MIDYECVFENAVEEHGAFLDDVVGTIPRDLSGTILRNGAGRVTIGEDQVSFFDGSGLVAGMTFRDGRAFVRARFVDTPLYRAESAAGKQTARRVFTNLPRGGNRFNLNLGNPAMHDAVHFGGRVLATDDPGYYQLDDKTLDTVGEDRWHGRVGKRDKMCAVPRVDPERGTLVSYRIQSGPFGDRVTFFEFDRDWNVVSEVTHKLALGFGVTHEVAFTKKYYVLPEQPLTLSVGPALWGTRTPFDCVARKAGQNARVHLVPRDGEKARTVELDAGVESLFHVANAFEDGEAVVVDATVYSALASFAYFAPPKLRALRGQPLTPTVPPRFVRYRVLGDRVTQTTLAEASELPRINAAYEGRAYRNAYVLQMIAREGNPDPFAWPTQLARIDVTTGEQTTWSAGAHRFVSQPVFAPGDSATREDDGYVLSWTVDGEAKKSEVVILRADALAKGPIATVRLNGFLGLASHSRFEPALSLMPSSA